MDYELAKQLKEAGYRTDGYILGHVFYPHPKKREPRVWVIADYVLSHHIADLNEGYSSVAYRALQVSP